ncbi:MAG: transporter related [Alphaproteobacteria bacterium]|jgi:branched-chain amino acid transport system ATP-binding protein|nr:transporter related [Alphaproteobacteria bacterium]
MLTLADFSSGYRKGLMVLNHLSLEVASNQIGCIVGSNGAGKTTLLRSILNQIPFSSGDIEFNGASLRGQPTHRISRQGVALVPEGRGTFPSLTVRENLQMGGYASKGDISATLDRELDRFPILRERANQRAGMLSGGQQQMLAIARAMMSNPKLLLLDEPSQGLAPIIMDQIFALIANLKGPDVTILLVEQDVGRALEIADRGFVLEKGSITRAEQASVLLADPYVREAFLGMQ